MFLVVKFSIYLNRRVFVMFVWYFMELRTGTRTTVVHLKRKHSIADNHDLLKT